MIDTSLEEPVALRAQHVTVRNAYITVFDRNVFFNQEGLSEPLSEAEWDCLLSIPGYAPEFAFEDDTDALPADGECPEDADGLSWVPEDEDGVRLDQFPSPPEDEEDDMAFEAHGDGWFDVWESLSNADRLDMAMADEFGVDHLLCLQEWESTHKNSKKVLTLLNDQIIRRCPPRSARDVNRSLLNAVTPQEVEV